MKLSKYGLSSALALAVSGLTCPAQRLPAGQTLEVRLLSVTGSKVSKAGDPVEAVVISPLILQGKPVLPAGVHVRGTIAVADPLGFGFKRQTARMAYRFDRLALPNGEELPIECRLRGVDTARERVDSNGFVRGIRPTTNVSSSLAVYAWRLLWLEPAVALPVWGVKFLFARAPDPEIRYPAGTELVLELTSEIDLSSVVTVANRMQALEPSELLMAQDTLAKLGTGHSYDKNGKAADRVNLMFIATEGQVLKAFDGAGWSHADRRSIKSIFRTYRAVVERMGYSRAPVNNLLLGGQDPAFVFQKSLNTFAKRHHGRVWRGPEMTDGRHLWIMAATEDVGIRMDFKRMRFIHEADPQIENERAKIVNDLSFTQCVDSAALIKPAGIVEPTAPREDTRVAVLRLNDCEQPVGADVVLARNVKPAPRIARLFQSLGDEIIRSNAIFLGYNTTRLTTATKSLFARKPYNSPRGNDQSEQQSDLFTFTAAPPAHTDILSTPPTDKAAASSLSTAQE